MKMVDCKTLNRMPNGTLYRMVEDGVPAGEILVKLGSTGIRQRTEAEWGYATLTDFHKHEFSPLKMREGWGEPLQMPYHVEEGVTDGQYLVFDDVDHTDLINFLVNMQYLIKSDTIVREEHAKQRADALAAKAPVFKEFE